MCGLVYSSRPNTESVNQKWTETDVHVCDVLGDILSFLSLLLSPQMMNVLWWYYFSKLIEFMDTFFFILRKNHHQITFLHVYHHFTMLNIWWFVMNWVPCGHCKFLKELILYAELLRCKQNGVKMLVRLVFK